MSSNQFKPSTNALDERAAFEADYAKAWNAAYDNQTSRTAEDVAALREGDGYGEARTYLYERWAGWQACAAYHAAPPQSEEPDGWLVRGEKTYLYIDSPSKPGFVLINSGDTVLSVEPRYAAPQPSPTAVVPYRAASDCQYVGASEEAKCAWADGWNQCAQFTKGSHDGY